MTAWKNLPPLFPRGALHPAVMARAVLSQAEGNWCVAFSGGADSLALLLLLYAHWPEKRATLTALHFNHRLRGKESEADEAFCREVCAGLEVEFCAGSWDDARADAGEAVAREARQVFFAREMAARNARVLWTGHQKNDIAETLLMRLARGSGAAGLSAPRPVQPHRDGVIFLRPLLALEKAEIVAALRMGGVLWREDPSNVAGDFFRNRIRRDVLPGWRVAALNDALAGAALTRELLEEDDAALDAWSNELMPLADYTRSTLDLGVLVGRPRALWRRALRRWLPLAEMGRLGFEEVLAVCERGEGRVNATAGWVTVSAGVMRFSSAPVESITSWSLKVLDLGGMVGLSAGAALRANPVEFTAELREHIRTGGVNPAQEAFAAVFDEQFTVRPWCAGDRYRPLGAPGSAKLQDLFVNRKIPTDERQRLPVVCRRNGSILWVPGFPPAEDSKMTDTSVTGVRLTYQIGTNTVHPQSLPVNV